jgi:kumamolisin
MSASTVSSPRVIVPGSEKTTVPDSHAVGPAPGDERLEVTVRLRPKTPLQSLAWTSALEDLLPKERTYLSHEEYTTEHGADPQNIVKVEDFAQAHGLKVVEVSAARRSVVLAGTVSAMNAAFGVSLQQFEHPGGTYRGRTGAVSVPADLAGIVEGVFGLDDRPQAKPHFVRSRSKAAAPAQANGSFTPTQLAKLYNFPAGLDGTGQCIALIELDGGFRPADIKTYFTGLGLPVPHVKAIRVGGGKNHPTNPEGPDGEVMLDIEVAAAVAPKATIAVYFAPNTSQGFLDAVTTALHDTVNKPSVISISWGNPESKWTQQSMQQLDQAFQAAAALGVTICVASGDNGSGDGETDGLSHVDFPASSSFALACGGTKLAASGNTITKEAVWNSPRGATGGGVSDTFPLPGYQASAPVPPSANPGGHIGRGVPDVAGDADPATGYHVRVDGQNFVIGGTSAVAPLWAGLVALMNQKLTKPVGFLNPLLYGSLAGKNLFLDITTGSNGAYSAKAGWDACTGWGSPKGADLLKALGG